MPIRFPLFFLAAFAFFAFAPKAAADLNIAPGAHATASSWHEEKLLVNQRDAIPRNAIDGSSATGWQPEKTATGPQWLQLDFTRPWPMRYRWKRLVTTWSEPPASYRWDVSHDGVHWTRVVERRPTGVTDAVSVNAEGSYLRVVVGAGEPPRLLEVETYARSGGTGTPGDLAIDLHGNRATIRWDAGSARNVFLYRLTRSAGIEVGSGGHASMISLVAEGPITQTVDRVEFPTVGNIQFSFRWALEAYGPDGQPIGAPQYSAFYDIPIRSNSPFHIRGVVEGYYGPDYSFTERADLVRYVGMQGGNFYLYGPKLDPYHRERWRTPYPAEEIAAFQELVEYGQSHGVTVAWSLSPGLDYKATAADDAAVIAKYLAMHKAGVRWFALFMDDIPIDADAAAANEQVALANKVFNALQAADPDTRLLFVPTVYSGDAASLSPAARSYLSQLAALHPSIWVAWTGTEIFAKTMTAEQMEPIARLVGRPLVLWDNVPVADFFLGRRLNLGPLAGRAADLAAPASDSSMPVLGYLSNPMWLPAANRLPLASIFDYLLEPEEYQGDTALAARVLAEAPPYLQPHFAQWVDAFRTNPLVGVTTSTTLQILTQTREALARGEFPPEAFLQHAAALYLVEPALADLHFADLAGDLLSPARDAARIGEAILKRWQAWTSSDETERSEHLAHSRGLLENLTGWIVSEGEDIALLNDFGGEVRLHGAPAISGKMPREMVSGRTRRIRFGVAGGEGRLLGLPGAVLRDGIIEWKPRHTGEYRWVILSTNHAGTGLRYGSVRVVEELPDRGGGCQSASHSPPVLLALVLLLFRKARRFSFTEWGTFR